MMSRYLQEGSRTAAALVFVFLFLSLGLNAFGIANTSVDALYQWDSQALVLGKLKEIASTPGSLEAWMAPLCSAGEGTPGGIEAHRKYPSFDCGLDYFGNPGAQAFIFAPFAILLDLAGVTGIVAIRAMEMVASFLLCGVLTGLCLLVRRRFGGWPALGMILAFAGSPHLIMMGSNLYWLPALWFAPSLYLAWRLMQEKPRMRWREMGAICLLLMVFHLGGFEYVTNILLTTALTWLCFSFDNLRKRAVRREKIAEGARLAVSMAASVPLAIMVHVVLNARNMGSFAGAWNDFASRVLYRTVDASGTGNEKLVESLEANRLEIVTAYLRVSDGGIAGLSIGVICMAAIMAIVALKLFLGRPLTLPTGLAALAVLSTLSWHILAVGHSVIHTHINPVLGILPAAPVLMGLIFYVGSTAWHKMRDRATRPAS